MKGIHSLLSTLFLFLSLGCLQPEGFVRQYYGLLEEGLMAGTLSAAWPLMDVKERQPKLKYSKRKVEGQQLHELTYSPKSRGGTLQLRIKLFFNLETFHHVMTEYKYYYSGIELLFLEQFEDFREVDGMTLPHKYTIYYSSDRYDSNLSFPGEPHPTAGLGSPSIVRWTFKAKQWMHNAHIDPKLFKAY